MAPLQLAIIKELYFSGMQSIADLSKSIGKSIPNITRSIQQLTENQIISSEGPAPSTGGRRAIRYSLRVDHLPNILAIAIDQFNTSITLLDLSNKNVKSTRCELINLHDDKNPYDSILKLIDDYLSDQTQLKSNIAAIGITMPGFVDSDKGVNTSYPDHHPFFDIRSRIASHTRIPTFIENDSTAIAIAEHNFGRAKGSSDVLVVNLNWGVGLGMILKNELFKGHTGFAGEFSHIPLSDLNKLCSCGKRGCLEVEASLVAALEFASQKLQSGDVSQLSPIFQQTNTITIDQLIESALNGDQIAIESFARIGYMLGKGIATLIHIINPEKIVISGKGAKIGRILLPQIQASILEFSINRLSQHTSIEISSLQEAQIIGSGCTALSALNAEILNNKIKTITLN